MKTNLLFTRLEINKFTDKDNNWEMFFWLLIILALIKRFTTTFFKLLGIPLFFKDDSFNLLYFKISKFWFKVRFWYFKQSNFRCYRMVL